MRRYILAPVMLCLTAVTACGGGAAPLPRAASLEDLVKRLQDVGLTCSQTVTSLTADTAYCLGARGGEHTPCPPGSPTTAQCVTDPENVTATFYKPFSSSAATGVVEAHEGGTVLISGLNFGIDSPPALAGKISKATGGRIQSPPH